MATEDELIAARRAKAARLRELGTQAYPNDFRASVEDKEGSRRALFERISAAKADPAALAALPEEAQLTGSEPRYWLFGRVMGRRGPFVVVSTPFGSAQALARAKVGKDGMPALPEPDASLLAELDLADHVALHGPLVRTRTGDVAVRADAYTHVSKALLPPPEKWHGLTDVETRYRQRYVDLFASPDVARVFRARSIIVRELRRFLDERGFLEVETPLLHPLRGGATARPFETHHNVLDAKLYLRIAPELYLKRLVVGGFDRVYEIGRCFRNEGVSTRHNPEFTMLEFYQAYATYEDLMDLTELLLRAVDRSLHALFGAQCPEWWASRPFDLDAPFARVDMRDAIVLRTERSGESGLAPTPFDGILTPEIVRDGARLGAAIEEALGIDRLKSPEMAARVGKAHLARWFDAKKHLAKCGSHGERVFVLYEVLVEPDLPQLYRNADGTKSVPVFVMKHPFEVSPLARKSDAEPAVTDRFELFIEGREVANAFSELNDADDQASRFAAQLDRQKAGDDEAMDFDADYVRALSHGMPPAAGFGMGVDRLVMTLCGQPSIRDVLLFPALRPEAPKGHEPKASAEGPATK